MTAKRILIVFTVPASDLDPVLEAIAGAGAGEIGEYTHCSFSNEGIGRFLPGASANPALGERGQVNQEAEVRVESFCSRENAKAVIAAIRDSHPYEEPVYYLIPLLDEADL